MKRILLSVYIIVGSFLAQGQITDPVIKANFGVEADLRANYFDGFLQAGNDDWFGNGDPGPGTFIIDTTGAAFLKKVYISNPAYRRTPFFRNMRFPQFSVINNMMLIDAVFIRDHHGDDSTVFASGSNKNGMSPVDWSCPVSQGIPDKNDILDMGMHVRRAGPNGTDSLWMFGVLSLDNTTGNRYFDFEMYQTDITYNRPTLSFTGYGPDFGHTSWTFDASGNVLTAGDIIFTAEYSSSNLSALEARIWVKKTDMSITPAAFSWGSTAIFDGGTPGATYGYARILPKTAGDFYTGLQCSNNTWGGPFGIVLQDNSLATNYSARQLMEFSVNLSKLGLDPLVNQGDPCKMPFRRILVKSRASTSFTAELKDFVGPFSFFRAPALGTSADIPYFCGSSDVRTLSVTNPLPTSLYVWTTPDGSILGDNVGPQISINLPGTYIVSQELMDSCGSTWARDTIVVPQNNGCIVLNSSILSFKGLQHDNVTDLSWQIGHSGDVQYFVLERSTDNNTYSQIYKRDMAGKGDITSHGYTDDLSEITAKLIFYRLKIVERNGGIKYSRIIAVSKDPDGRAGIKVLPNPVKTNYTLLVTSSRTEKAVIEIADLSGQVIERMEMQVQKGSSVVSLVNPVSRAYGMYLVRLSLGDDVYTTKLLYIK
jgi:hypothetical protein